MITEKDDMLQALADAFVMEKGTRIFYSGAAEKAVHPDAKKTFRELADWEAEHMDYILFLYQSVNGDRDVQSFEDFRDRAGAAVTEAGVPIKELDKKIERHTFSTEQEALNLAMRIEGNAYNHYRRLSGNVKDTNARVIFQEMMQQETRHIEYLKKLKAQLGSHNNNT